jgi:uncharacterized protein (DUF1778 family)
MKVGKQGRYFMPTHSMDTNMNFRLSSKDKKLVETAAKLRGVKLNTYVRQKLLEVAEKDIIEMNELNNVVLSESVWNQFLAVMEAPIEMNQNLIKAIEFFNQNELR